MTDSLKQMPQHIINASGPVTRLGGALMPDAALNAYMETAATSVSIEQLQGRLADQCGARSSAFLHQHQQRTNCAEYRPITSQPL